VDGERDAGGEPDPEAEGPVFAWDEENHPLDASWGYQNHFVPAMFRPSAEAALAQVRPSPGARVLDAGCGTGALAFAAAALVGEEGKVAGLDLNPAQLAVARELDSRGAIEWREGDLAAIPYEDAAFDAVYCLHVLQFVPDRVAVLRELGRVAATGKPVVVAVWDSVERNPVFVAVADAFGSHGDEETAAIVRSPRVFEDPGGLAQLSAEAGLEGAEVTSHDVPVLIHDLRRLIEELPPPLAADAGPAERELRESVLAHAERTLRSLASSDPFAFDDRLHLLVVPAP
jgi:ubiquinone/menaquinone biosynthesis C-methylase UbiE